MTAIAVTLILIACASVGLIGFFYVLPAAIYWVFSRSTEGHAKPPEPDPKD